MAQFVMVIDNVNSKQFEKIIEIQVKSGDKIRFIPQSSNNHDVSTKALSSTTSNVNRGGQVASVVSYHNIRLEFGDDAAQFAHEIYDLFIPMAAEAQKAG